MTLLVVKVGGGFGIEYEALCEDIKELKSQGTQLILVHGGSAKTNTLSCELGKPPRFVTSVSGYESRYTDREAMDIFIMACAALNREITMDLQRRGVNAVGLCGIDGGLLKGRRKDTLKIVEDGRKKVLRGDHSGTLDEVNGHLLSTLLEAGYLPVIGPPGLSHDGQPINVDGDRMAAALAIHAMADTLIILTNTPGVLRDVEDEGSRVSEIPYERLSELNDLAQGRMRMKLLAVEEALASGVGTVVIGDARREKPLSDAQGSMGTTIKGRGV